VQGFGIDPVTLQATGQLGDIQLTNAVAAPRASTQAGFSVNLDANAVMNGPFDPANPNGTSSFQSVITLYDPLGAPHASTLYFTRTGANAWDWSATLATADTTLPPNSPGDAVVVQGAGTLSFDSLGNLTAATGTPLTYEFAGGAAAAQSVAIDFGPIAGVGSGDPTTQYAGAQSAVNSQTQDGFGPGTLSSVGVDRSGFFVASFSNGETRPIAQVALATFPNVGGLDSIGNNGFAETRDSGQPLIGAPRSSTFGSIRSNHIEQSNVDLAAQFIRLILQQRAFQANTRTVSTTNELLANLVQLGQ
jgi:flagellar hook protein FlgE